MSVASADSSGATPAGAASEATPHTRAGVVAFVGIGVVASAVFLYLGRRVWFFNDEWDFIATRRAGSFDDLMRPHFGHWSTIPILVYRFLWWTVGLHSYVPYQVLIIALHLTAAWLLRVVMRRAGVRPWIATAAASSLVLFGRGYQDIVWAFQITQVGSLVFGLTHLLLVDHDGPLDRRDWIGLAAGGAGLLCSGVAVPLVIVVGITALVRRGWRVAAVHTVPLGGLYLVWWYAYARGTYSTQGITPVSLARFVAGTIANVVRAVGSYDVIAALLGALLLAGLIVAWRPLTRVEWSKRAGVTFALLIGAVAYLVITAFGRAGLPGATHRSRYLDLTLAMLLPSFGVAAEALVRRWRTAGVAMIALLVIGMPGNVRAIAAYTHNQERTTAEFRQTVFLLPRLPVSKLVPPSTRPLAPFTIGWLLGATASGRVPAPSSITNAERAITRLRLVLRTGGVHPPVAACRPAAPDGLPIDLEPGAFVRVQGAPVEIAPYAGATSGYLPLSFGKGTTLSSARGTAQFRVFPKERAAGLPRLCGSREAFRVVR